MIVFVNNKQIELTSLYTIPALLENVQIKETKGIAVAVNNTVVSKTYWEKFELNENDRITIIRATQGG